MVAMRLTKEQFEAYPIGPQSDPAKSYRFFGNETWHVFNAQEKEAYDALVSDPPAEPVKQDDVAALRAMIDELFRRVADLENRGRKKVVVPEPVAAPVAQDEPQS